MNGTAILAASAAVLLLAYLVHGRRLEKSWGIEKEKKAPGRRKRDDMDYIPSSTPVLFGHHFSALAGVGFLIGTIRAASFGWLPALLWILVGGVFVGALLDVSSMFVSVRSGGRSVPAVMKEAVHPFCGVLVLLYGWLCLVVFSGAMVDAAAEIFTGVSIGARGMVTRNSTNGSVAMAMMLFVALAVMFGFINRARMNLAFTTVMGLLLMGVSIWLGVTFPLYAGKVTWIFILLCYVFLASVTPVWALLQPRNYLNSLLFFVLIGAAVAGICLGGARMQLPAVTNWVNESTDTIFPALFVFLSGGVTSGVQGLAAGGTASKQMQREKQLRPVGYGSMLLVCLMCVVALVVVGSMDDLPKTGLETVGEDVFGLTRIFAHGIGGFFEALGLQKPAVSVLRIVILLAFGSLAMTALDTSVRVARYLFQELFTGKEKKANALNHMYTASIVTAAAVGGFACGAYRMLWELFSGANLLLAAFLLIGVACWMKASGKKCRLYYLPICTLLAIGWSDLGILFVENAKAFFASGRELRLAVQNGCIAAILLLSVIVLTEGIKTVFFEPEKELSREPEPERELEDDEDETEWKKRRKHR